MKLSDVELIPGVVAVVNDPDQLGRVKAIVPGIFESENPRAELPWIYPLFAAGSNQFKSPKEGDKIWLWYQRNNYSEYWFTPFFQLSEEAKEIVRDYQNVEIIYTRKVETGSNTEIYSSDDAGLVLNAEGASIRINSGGTISAVAQSEVELQLTTAEAKIGKQDGLYESAVLGDKLASLLGSVKNAIIVLENAARGCPYTYALVEGFKQAKEALNDIESIKSNNVKVN